jgi:hypothetical protein
MPVFALAWFIACPARGQAVTVYVTQTGSAVGNCTGTPRLSAAEFSNASNWGTSANQIGPGTTVLLCGTVTTGLTFQASGVAGRPITLKFDSGAVMSSPVWPWNTGAINSASHGYLVIDGGTNGVIKNTANGIGLANQVVTTAVQLGPNSGSTSNVEIKNLTCADMFVMTAGSTWPSVNNNHLNCVYDGGSGGNISIHNNVIHDVAWAIDFQGNSGSSGISIYDNEIYNFDHGFALGLDNCSPSCSATNVSFHDNHVHDPGNWDDPSDSNHHDGIHIYDNAGSNPMTIDGVEVYNNLFDGNWGAHFTAEIYCQPGPGTIENFNIYNNVFAMPSPKAGGNGLVTCDNSPGATLSVYNNTFIGGEAANGNRFYCFKTAHDNIDFRNNVFADCPVPIGEYNIGEPLPAPLHWDHNVYENTSSYWGWGPATYKTFAAFQAACGCDLTGSTSITTDYSTSMGVPMTGSPVLHAGTDLCGAFSCTGSFQWLAKDTSAGDTRNPVARPTGANAWDIGAYQVSNVSLPAAPTGLTATVQ